MRHFSRLLIAGALIVASMGLAGAQDTTAPESTPEVAAEATTEPAASTEKAYLGILFTPDEAGIAVAEVVADSPAEAAGILAGDVITAVNDVAVTEDNAQETIQGFAVGDTVTVTLVREGETLTLDVTLAAAPELPPTPRRVRPTIEVFRPTGPMLGVSIEDAEGGARVVYVTEGSPADDAGILVDDVITAINGAAIDGAQAAVDAVADAGKAAEIGEFALDVTLVRDGETLDVTATLTKEDMPTLVIPPMRHRREDRGFGAGLNIIPREDGGFDVAVPFTPADPDAVTPEVIEALAGLGIGIAPVEGEDGAYTLTLPSESLGGGLNFGMFALPERGFRFEVPHRRDITPEATPEVDDTAA